MRRLVFALFLVCLLTCSTYFGLNSSLRLAFGSNSSGTTNSSRYSWPMFLNNPSHSGSFSVGAPITNQILWTFGTGRNDVWASPAVVNGVVYIGSMDDYVYALDASTGSLIWSYLTGGVLESSPAVVNGLVFIGSHDGNVYALNASTGSQIWTYKTVFGSSSSPVVADGVVYIGSEDSAVYALNASTGTQIWSFKTTAIVVSSPAVANGVVYVGANDKKIYALNATTGFQIWNFDTTQPVYSSPTVANGVVYFGSYSNYVYALNASTGEEIWSFKTGNGIWASPSISDGVVYIGSMDDNFYALDASTGAEIWNFSTGSGVWSSAAVASGVVYVGSWDGNLYALNASSGNQIWSQPIGGVQSSPAVVDGVLFVGGYDSFVYAFGSALIAPSISASFNAIEQGQTVTLNSTEVNTGAFPYTYQWLEKVPGEAKYVMTSSNTAIFDFDTSVSTSCGTWSFMLQVTDSAGASVNSSAISIGVNSAPNVSITPAFTVLDAGQYKTFTANPKGGSGKYTSYQWYVDGIAQGGATTANFTYYTAFANSASITLTVTDSLGVTSSLSAVANVVVNTDPTVSITPQSTTLDLGQSKLFIANSVGGSGIYTSYQWIVNGSAVPGQTASTFNYSPAYAGTYLITATVTDNLDMTSVQSTASSVNVNQLDITVTQGINGQIAPGTSSVIYGGSQTFTITPNAGYSIASVTVDNSSVAVASSYVFSNLQASHTISATFASNSSPTPDPTAAPTASSTLNPTFSPTSSAQSPFTATPNASDSVSSSPTPSVPEFSSTLSILVIVMMGLAVLAVYLKRLSGLSFESIRRKL